jgi:hypothetical protein
MEMGTVRTSGEPFGIPRGNGPDRKERVAPEEVHETITAEDAFELVHEYRGVAFVFQATAAKAEIESVVFNPLGDG